MAIEDLNMLQCGMEMISGGEAESARNNEDIRTLVLGGAEVSKKIS